MSRVLVIEGATSLDDARARGQMQRVADAGIVVVVDADELHPRVVKDRDGFVRDLTPSEYRALRAEAEVVRLPPAVWCAVCRAERPDYGEHTGPDGQRHRPPTIWGRVSKFIVEVVGPQGGVFAIARNERGWFVSSEFGREAPDSPMVAGAIYGSDAELARALDQALRDARR